MPGIRIDGRDHPILRDLSRDPEHTIRVRVEVLPHDRRQHRRGLLNTSLELPPIQSDENRVGVFGERVDQRLARSGILVITDRLPRGRVLVIAQQHGTQLRLELPVDAPSTPRIAERISVTVSIVATAS